MYATCIHCNAALGTNESIETFPIGRRLAFDASNGRLWVVCKGCERWNLSPIEERWEAIEECDRAFRDTRVRVSTDNIGLARLPDDTELVRVGKPQRPEFAAWRYGDQFGRRRRKTIAVAAATTVGIGAALAGGVAVGASMVAIVPVFQVLNVVNILRLTQGASNRMLPLPDGSRFRAVGGPKLASRSDVPEGWGITIGYAEQLGAGEPAKSLWQSLRKLQDNKSAIGEIRLRGNDATAVMRWALPRINRAGASRAVVADGVGLIESAGAPDRFGAWAVTQLPRWNTRQTFGDNGDMQHIPPAARLAFEMALHEDTERRALDGELHELEDAWRDADAIARIADTLLQPAALDARIAAIRKTLRGKGDP